MDLLKKYPCVDGKVVFALSPEGTSLYNLDYAGISPRKKKITLDKAGDALLICFDGRETLENIIRKLTNSEENFKLSIPFVIKFIEGISEYVPIRFYDHVHPIKIEIKGDKNKWVPLHASLELTNKCNLKCVYCYNNSSSQNNDFLRDPLKVLGNIYKMGVQIVELTGGEPLLHPEILRIIEFVGKNFALAALLTNGCLIDDSILKNLKEYRDKFIVQVCLDGSTPETVEITTGTKGSFKKIIKAIENLSKEGIIVRVGMIIDSVKKLDDIEDTLILAKDLGAKFFQISTALPLGRGKNLNLQFNEEDVLKLKNLVELFSEKYPSFFISEPESRIEGLNKRDSLNCGAGYRSIVIGTKGEIRPCVLSPDELGILGQVRCYSGELIIELSSSVTTLFSKLEAPNEEICQDCKYLFYCYKCVVRGLIKSKEIGEENCNWVKKSATIIHKKDLVESGN